MPKQGSKGKSHPNSEVEKFARAFKTEKELREHLETLFRKMGRLEVRITHGTSERGKDIVFYGPSGLDDHSLYACVVKNDRIVGDVTSPTAAQVVFHQAEQALCEPYRNPSTGELEKVKAVYVISPHEALPSAIDSIAAQLAAKGTVEFFCGARLFDLFAKHYRSFLLFESTVLVSYLSALRTSLQRDRALIELALRQSILAEVPSEFEAMYVPQGFGDQVVHAQPAPDLFRQVQIPTAQLRLTELEAIEEVLRKLGTVANHLDVSGRLNYPRAEWGEPPSRVFDNLVQGLRNDWKSAYESYLGGLAREQAKLPKELRGASPKPPSQRQAVLNLVLQPETKDWIDRAELLRTDVLSLIAGDCSKSNSLTTAEGAPELTITGEAFLAFCSLQSLAEDSPGSILFDKSKVIRNVSVEPSFLERGISAVLVVGPAGFGKTSFCKWQALSSAGRLLAQEDDVLPVYVPLYKFASYVPVGLDDAFFESLELRQLLADESRNTRIRLFLDGLDEIPDAQKQQAMVNLALTAARQVSDCQVVITARDHVRGAWLAGIPRVRVNELDEAQQRRLVENWLGSTAATDKFFEQLPPALRGVMGVPLLATLTAAVYKKHQHLPSNRTALYSLFIELLCGGWDAVKGTNRGSRFGIHDKQLVLKRLAGVNHLAGRRDASLSDFRAAVRASLSGLIEHANDLLGEMLQDGLIVRTGAGVRFSHLSFQEFMAAEYLRDPDSDRPKLALRKFFGGDDWWKEVLIYYVTNTSQPSEMEDWLIKRAQTFAQTASSESFLSGEVDARLNSLRRALADAFPAYRSRYPENGVTVERTRRRSGDSVYMDESLRTLAGARVEPQKEE